MNRFVLIAKFTELTGYTQKAAETKISRGIWLQGREYVQAPDGRILMDMEGFNKWAASQPAVASGHAMTA